MNMLIVPFYNYIFNCRVVKISSDNEESEEIIIGDYVGNEQEYCLLLFLLLAFKAQKKC